MYAEVKSTNKVLINRLDDGEKILLKEIYEESKKENAKVELTSLLDEYGEFGGVMLEVTQEEPVVEVVEETEVEETTE